MYFRAMFSRLVKESSFSPQLPPFKMVVNENSGGLDSGQVVPGGRHTLVEVTNQLNAKNFQNDTAPYSEPPQVVFVEKNEQCTEISELLATTEAVVASSLEETFALEPIVIQPEFGDADSEPEVKFLVNPFDHEIDGAIPELPSLPVAKPLGRAETTAIEDGDAPYAWRLQRPYPDLGNIPNEETKVRNSVEEAQGKREENAVSQPLRKEVETVDWVDTEVVAEGDAGQYGDNFYARPGDVITIDGKQGYEHIDLRSYGIEDAQFQPGSILLSSPDAGDNGGASDEQHSPEPPIIIRHRNVDYAIFRGDVRVELYSLV